MRTVRWFSCDGTKAEVWRVLDLAGLTTSVRFSRNYTLSGFVYVGTNKVTSLKETVDIGKLFRLEIRFPNGKIVGDDILLVNRKYPPSRQARSLEPTKLWRKG